MIHQCLHNDGVIPLTIIIVRSTFFRAYYWYVRSINGSGSLGNPQNVSNPSTISFNFSPQEIWTYCGSRGVFIARHVSTTILPTVERPRPNREDSVQYSMLVANFHLVTATLSSTETGDRKLVTCTYMNGAP